MIELAKHIKVLLLENDCVIIPGFGGFIAHNCPAIFNRENGSVLPPRRTIGFNPQLTINDGLLVQSYMLAYNTDFPDATRKIEKLVAGIKDMIYNDGSVEFHDLGTLYFNVEGEYEFEPMPNVSFSPSLYGLTDIRIEHLNIARQEKKIIMIPQFSRISTPAEPANKIGKKRHILRNVIHHSVTVAAAVILFFILSVPVENTFVDDANYASIGSVGLFESIRKNSAATNLLTEKYAMPSAESRKVQTVQKAAGPKNINTLKPVAVKTEYVKKEQTAESKPVANKPAASKPAVATAKAAKKQEESKAQNNSNVKSNSGSYIIISSLESMADAQKELKKHKAAGCKDALIVESKGRYRIAYQKFANKADAYKKMNELKANSSYKDAWVFNIK